MLHIIPPPRKKWVKPLFLSIAIILICAFIGTSLIWTVYHLPIWEMENTLQQSAQTIKEEGTYPQLLPWCSSQLDNFTDALMMSIAGYRSEDRNIIQTMKIPVPQNIDSAPSGRFIARYVDGIQYTGYSEYSRYWHGYLVFLKPLLLFINYNSIRFLNAAMQMLVLGWLLYLMDKRGLKTYIMPFMVSFAFLSPVTIMSSLQFSSCYYMMILGSIALLSLKDNQYIQYAPYLFLFIGIGTVYFDFLTYPAITLGVPAILYCCRRGPMTIKSAMKEGTNICFFWGFGYVGMWISKWILGSLFLGKSALNTAIHKLAQQSSLDAEQAGSFLINIQKALRLNIQAFFRSPAVILFVLMILVLTILIIRNMRKQWLWKKVLLSCFPFAVLAFIPFVWYVVASNHSYIHFWFTNKAMMVSVFAVLCALTQVLSLIKESAKQ